LQWNEKPSGNAMAYKKKLLIIHSCALIRLGLLSAAQSANVMDDSSIRAYAGLRDSFKELLKLKEASIVVLDFSAWANLETHEGGSLVRALADRGIAMVLHASVDHETARHIKTRGIRGLIPVDADVDVVHRVLRELAVGRSCLQAEDQATTESQIFRLWILQLKILRSLCRGQLGRQIPIELGISRSAFKDHLSFVRKKLGFARTTQLVAAFAGSFRSTDMPQAAVARKVVMRSPVNAMPSSENLIPA
jgi:DNA-binding NarL/FixJ family response regulator